MDYSEIYMCILIHSYKKHSHLTDEKEKMNGVVVIVVGAPNEDGLISYNIVNYFQMFLSFYIY
jgi:hypothetical protein